MWASIDMFDASCFSFLYINANYVFVAIYLSSITRHILPHQASTIFLHIVEIPCQRGLSKQR